MNDKDAALAALVAARAAVDVAELEYGAAKRPLCGPSHAARRAAQLELAGALMTYGAAVRARRLRRGELLILFV